MPPRPLGTSLRRHLRRGQRLPSPDADIGSRSLTKLPETRSGFRTTDVIFWYYSGGETQAECNADGTKDRRRRKLRLASGVQKDDGNRGQPFALVRRRRRGRPENTLPTYDTDST